MRFSDDFVVYTVPRRRVVHDYGFTVDNAELARVEDAARMMSNQTIDDVDYIRNSSRRSDDLAIERANRLIESSMAPTYVRSPRYPVYTPGAPYYYSYAPRYADRLRRAASVSDVSRVHPDAHYLGDGSAFSYGRYPHRHIPRHQLPPSTYHYTGGYYGPSPAEIHVPISDYRRRLERSFVADEYLGGRRLDVDLLNYELPKADSYSGIRAHLRGVNDKLLAHRLLLDRYAGIEMSHPDSVEYSVESKASQLMARMPTSRGRH